MFDYDGVYDEMKSKTVKPKAIDREERKVLLRHDVLVFIVGFVVVNGLDGFKFDIYLSSIIFFV